MAVQLAVVHLLAVQVQAGRRLDDIVERLPREAVEGPAQLAGVGVVLQLILNKPVIGPLIAGIIGLIPNCASSVVLTQLYIEGVLGLGSLMAGLLAGSGVGILVLFRENDDMKDNFRILAILYVSGVAWGIIIDALSKIIL